MGTLVFVGFYVLIGVFGVGTTFYGFYLDLKAYRAKNCVIVK